MWMLLLLACPSDPQKADYDGDGYIADDCNPDDPNISPGATEVCDAVDQDCDGEVDEGVRTVFYADTDGDAYGDTETGACSLGMGLAEVGGDCDETNVNIHPGAAETCDGVDQDCDGEIDETPTDGITFWIDADGDSFGDDNGASTTACDTAPVGYAEPDDCDDTDPGISPAAAEICDDGLDQNCDGAATPCDLSGDIVVDQAPVTLDGSGITGWGRVVIPVPDPSGRGTSPLLAIGAPEDDLVYFVPIPLVEGPVGYAAAPGTYDSRDGFTLSGTEGIGRDGGAGAIMALGGCYDYLVGGSCMGSQLLIGDADAGQIWVVDTEGLGASGDLADSPTLTTDAGEMAVLAGGDFDGDGIGDLVVGHNGVVDAAVVMFGPFEGLGVGALEADITLIGEVGAGCGASLAAGRDGTGDGDESGYAELLVGCPRENRGDGAAYVLAGETLRDLAGTMNIDVVARTTVRGLTNEGAGIGSAVALTTFESTADLVVGAPEYDGDAGAIYIFSGASRDTVDVSNADWTVLGQPGEHHGATLTDGANLWRAVDPAGWESLAFGSGSYAQPDSDVWLVHRNFLSGPTEFYPETLDNTARAHVIGNGYTLDMVRVDGLTQSLIVADSEAQQIWLWPFRSL